MTETQLPVFSNWVHEYTEELYRFAYRKISNPQDAEDVVQNTFLSAYQAYASFDGKSSPKTWLFAILKNKVVDHYRLQHRRQEISGDLIFHSGDPFFDESGSWRPGKNPLDWHAEPEHLLDNPDFQHILNICKQQLPERWVTILNYKYLDGKDAPEICQELGMSPSNYWQTIHRAKLQLRACLEKNWFKK
jgi:RNA polymerase sigma-70 factor (ECF subfamily)